MVEGEDLLEMVEREAARQAQMGKVLGLIVTVMILLLSARVIQLF